MSISTIQIVNISNWNCGYQ